VSEQFALPLEQQRPLFIPLKGEWFDRFADGSKSVEWRAYGPRWNLERVQPGRRVILSRGYAGARLEGVVRWVHRIPRERAPEAACVIYPGVSHFCAFHVALTG
jgi:hypothetical protein